MPSPKSLLQPEPPTPFSTVHTPEPEGGETEKGKAGEGSGILEWEGCLERIKFEPQIPPTEGGWTYQGDTETEVESRFPHISPSSRSLSIKKTP